MFEPNELFWEINRLKKGRRVITNNFLPITSIQQLSKQNESLLLYNSEAIALLCNDNGIERLYFHLSGLNSAAMLGNLLSSRNRQPLVADCIGKTDQDAKLVQALCDIGFSRYTNLSRWRSNIIKLSPVSSNGMFFAAGWKDAERIEVLLRNTLDPLAGHLPSKEKLLSLIRHGLVFQASLDGDLVAAVCLEKTGKAGIYIYQIAVSKCHRSTGIGSRLLQYALSHFQDYLVFTSWVEDQNIASNRIHQKLGMKQDGLKDTVLLLN